MPAVYANCCCLQLCQNIRNCAAAEQQTGGMQHASQGRDPGPIVYTYRYYPTQSFFANHKMIHPMHTKVVFIDETLRYKEKNT